VAVANCSGFGAVLLSYVIIVIVGLDERRINEEEKR